MSTENRMHIDALAQYVADAGRVKFTEMNSYLRSRGIEIEGDEELTGEHVHLPHVAEDTTLLGPAGAEYVDIVRALFKFYPVTLMLGDMAMFRCHEEPWWVAWIGPIPNRVDASLARRPAVNRDIHDAADRAKYAFATATEKLAQMQYRLAELAGRGEVDRDESMRLQFDLVQVWETLYGGTLCAVRDSNTPDSTWDEADNTYSDGRRVINQIRVEPRETSDDSWEYNPFMLGDGAPNEFPLGTVSVINPVRPEDLTRNPERNNLESLRERLERHRDD